MKGVSVMSPLISTASITSAVLNIVGTVFVIACLLVVGYACKLVYQKQRNIQQVRQTADMYAQARLVAKTVGVVQQGHGSRSVGHLAFELPGGVRKDFEVDMPTYNVLLEGEEYILTYNPGIGRVSAYQEMQRKA